MDLDAVDEEDDSPCSGDGDEEPGVEGEAVEGGMGLAGPVTDEGGFDGPFKGSNGSRRAGNEVGEIGHGDGLPWADAIDDEIDDPRTGDEDHAFAGPDHKGLHEEKERSEDPDLTDAVEGKQEPALNLVQLRRLAGVLVETGKEALNDGLEGSGTEDHDEQSRRRDDEKHFGGKARVRVDSLTHKGDEEKNEDEDIEEFFEDDGGKDGGRRSSEVAGVGEDAHDVADAEGHDVVGRERGHENASADGKARSGGTHHLGPSHATQGVAGDGEADDTSYPTGMNQAKRAYLFKRDAAKGVPEEEGADEQTRYRFEEIAAAGFGHLGLGKKVGLA